MGADYWVPFRREDALAESAELARARFAMRDEHPVNMYKLMSRLQGKTFGAKGSLFIEQFDAQPGEDPAFVSYDTLTLHVDTELWSLARYGGPDERFILAHELAHIVVHDVTAKAFSEGEQKADLYGSIEHSAEWQADVWALYFLVPDKFVQEWRCVDAVAINGGLSRRWADERVQLAERCKLLRPKLEGETCPECANFTLVRNGTWLKCETCGAAMGCS